MKILKLCVIIFLLSSCDAWDATVKKQIEEGIKNLPEYERTKPFHIAKGRELKDCFYGSELIKYREFLNSINPKYRKEELWKLSKRQKEVLLYFYKVNPSKADIENLIKMNMTSEEVESLLYLKSYRRWLSPFNDYSPCKVLILYWKNKHSDKGFSIIFYDNKAKEINHYKEAPYLNRD